MFRSSYIMQLIGLIILNAWGWTFFNVMNTYINEIMSNEVRNSLKGIQGSLYQIAGYLQLFVNYIYPDYQINFSMMFFLSIYGAFYFFSSVESFHYLKKTDHIQGLIESYREINQINNSGK